MGNSLKKSSHSIDTFKHKIVHVVEVKYLGEFLLHLKFDDGFEKDIDMWPLIKDFGGVFEPIKNKDFFSQVRVDPEIGTIIWPNGVDYAPDVLYQK